MRRCLVECINWKSTVENEPPTAILRPRQRSGRSRCGRYAPLVWAFGAGLVMMGFAAPASAQVQIEVGIGTPRVGAHVVIGQPRPYVVERVYEPVYYEPVYVERVHVVHDHRCKHKHAHGWGKHEREYYKEVRHARREYEKDHRKGGRDRRW
jgi:hypothetical protein